MAHFEIISIAQIERNREASRVISLISKQLYNKAIKAIKVKYIAHRIEEDINVVILLMLIKRLLK